MTPVSAFATAPLRPDAVDLWGYLRSEIGLGATARGLATVLRRTGLTNACHDLPLPGRDAIPFDVDPEAWRAGTNIYVVNPPQMLRGERFLPHGALRETRRIGRWAWELSGFPAAREPALGLVDEIWVPSTFVARAVEEATAKPVHVIPCPVDRPPPAPMTEARAAALPGIPAEAYVFLTSFDFASSVHRKNPAGLLAAFRDSFPSADSTGGPFLVVKAHGGGLDRAAVDRLAADVAATPRALLIDRVLSPAEMVRLQDAADCFASLHRGEGFGRGLAEMMLAGKPVVATAYSGNLDFMTPGNSYLVDCDLVPVGYGEYGDGEGQLWAEPRRDSAVDALRAVYADRAEAARRAAAGRETIRRTCTIEALVPRLLSLLGRHPSP